MTYWREHRTLVTGGVVLGMAALVAWIGYLKLSAEPALNRQLPYFASAGMAVIVLTGIGAALVLGDLSRTDDTRVQELERAVTLLAGALASSIEAPPRREPAPEKTAATKTPAQKTPARKTPARKTPAKKTSTKKTPAKKVTARRR